LKVINSPFNDQLLAGSNTFGAQYALAQIPFQERIDFLNCGHLWDSLQFHQPDAQVRSNLS
jgi:hypothetical protein